jgi:hypothetical protein
MPDWAITSHNLFNAPAVYFVLPEPIDNQLFDSVVSVLSTASGQSVSRPDVERHWDVMVERLAGRSRWETVMPIAGVSASDPARIAKLQAADQSFRNIVTNRPYLVFVLDGLRFTIDVFNPADELELPGWPTGGSVLALLFSPTPERGRSTIRGLSSSEPFYTLLLALDSALNPARVCGTFSLASQVQALCEGRMRSADTFWEVLHPLTVVPHRQDMSSPAFSMCAVAKAWPRDRILLQVMPGFDPVMSERYERVASLLDLRSWTDYVEGRDREHAAEATGTRHTVERSWPTHLRQDGTPPTSIELVSSGHPEWVRQALYQAQAAVALEERGETISAFQVPLVGRRVRLTVPIVLTRQTGPDACVYTQCEAWTAERIGALQAWIRDLREESDSDVIVVSREPSDGVAALPDVAAFIHLPYDGLPEQ